MYRKYFGLDDIPFSIAVDPRFLFMSDRHRDALAHLIYGVGVGGGFILLTGEVGTGKTTITRCLLEQLPEQTDIALILNPALNAVELLAAVCDELGIDYHDGDESLKGMSDKLHQFLLANHERGRNTVLLIDEAQHLQVEVLEQIRLLTNLETNTKKLLQIILVGQPELQLLLERTELRQLSQRITARYQLKPFTLPETRAYIRHRLQVAGLPANQELFPPKVVQHIQQVSGGIPRLINVLCDRILLGTYGKNKAKVDMAMARQAVAEVKGEDHELSRPRSGVVGWSLLLLCLLLAGAALLTWQPWNTAGRQPPPELAQSEEEPAQDEKAPGSAEQSQTSIASDTDPVADPETKDEPVSAVEKKPPQLYFDEQKDALNSLLISSGIIKAPLKFPCGTLAKKGWRCDVLAVESWPDLFGFDSPVVLEILTKGRMKAWAVLHRVEGEHGWLRYDDGEYEVPLGELGEHWTGAFVLPWYAPTDYTGPMRRGDNSPAVGWLSQQFAELDGQQQRLTDTLYNEAMQQRVMLFQREESIRVDGVAGLKTLLRLNQRLGHGVPLLHSPTAASGEN